VNISWGSPQQQFLGVGIARRGCELGERATGQLLLQGAVQRGLVAGRVRQHLQGRAERAEGRGRLEEHQPVAGVACGADERRAGLQQRRVAEHAPARREGRGGHGARHLRARSRPPEILPGPKIYFP
jgi:hypothetical protein